MTRPPHPQRCETCSNEWCTLQQKHWERKITDLPTVEHRFVYEYGCASHSSPAAALVPDDRDMVIKMLEAEIDRLTGIEMQAAAKERERFPNADELEVLALALAKIHVFQPDFCNGWNLDKTDALMHKMERVVESLRGEQPGEYANAQGGRR